MTKEFCDICGKEIAPQEDSSYFKLKKLTFCFDEAWWEKLHVHTRCWKEMGRFIAHQKKDEHDEQIEE